MEGNKARRETGNPPETKTREGNVERDVRKMYGMQKWKLMGGGRK
jgi:hypothetical protein